MRTKWILITALAASLTVLACNDSFLDVKPNTDLVVPTTLEDFRRLMDDDNFMNITPMLGEVGSDDYYLDTKEAWESLNLYLRNAYIWKEDVFEGSETISDWNVPYKQVFVANIVLEGLEKMERERENATEYDHIKGWALFLRGHAFFQLSQLFAPPYNPRTAADDPGLFIRLEPGVAEPPIHLSLQATFDQIINDVMQAAELLQSEVPYQNRNRPSKAAAHALLARVYLIVQNYEQALASAEASLAIHSSLIQYDAVQHESVPFPKHNDEILYQATLSGSLLFSAIVGRNTIIDPGLYSDYKDNDLRKVLFFREVDGMPRKHKQYTGNIQPFGGLAVDEVMLTKAECLVRLGQRDLALSTLNDLLRTRFVDGAYKSYESEQDNILDIILKERRKELVFRGIRWMDIRRLNVSGYNLSISRLVDGQIFTIEPNSSRYTYPLPPDEARFNTTNSIYQ